jgi:hypothetical protein
MPDHEQVLVWHGSVAVMIDRELAPLIRWLWQQGIETCHCCQGSSEERAYISFSPGRHASNFANAILKLGINDSPGIYDWEMRHKILGHKAYRFLREKIGIANPEEWVWEWSCLYIHEQNDFILVCRFSHGDIRKVVEKLPQESNSDLEGIDYE